MCLTEYKYSYKISQNDIDVRVLLHILIFH